MNRIIIFFFTIWIAGACSVPTEQLQVYDLRCENLTDPLGIDTTSPHFSWKLLSDLNGSKQTAYQIVVATDSLLLTEGEADLWNSGKVKSPASVMVPYAGKELQARSHAYWKIGVWTKNSRQPVWSDAHFFSVGLLSPTDWAASYIGLPAKAGNPESPLLWKQYEINELAAKTFLHVNSLGYHEIYVNGSKVGIDVLSPSMSQFDKRSQAVAYDVSQYIRKGRNDLLIWLGRGWYQSGLPGVAYEGPLVKAQLETLKNGIWNTLLVSDTSWVSRESGYTGTSVWRYGNFGGECIESGKLLDDFTAATLDAATWNKAQEVDVPVHAVSPRMTEPNRIRETIRPVQVSPLEKNAWLVDMGKVFTGWMEIKFPALQKGQEITLEYCDHLVEDKPVNQRQIDRYIASGKNNETFRNRFNYHGYRYVKISNLSSQPSLGDIQGHLIHTDFKNASSFQCSDPEMNAIHDMVINTLPSLSLGGYMVDCQQYERLGYGGDGNASTQTAQTMFDMSPLYANWMQAWADCIREDGGMPHTAPNPWGAGGGPYWCGFIITASWSTYINYGDARLIEKYYPVMQHWLEYVQAYTVDGLLDKWPDTDYRHWFLGDWATPRGLVNQMDKSSVDLVNNSFITVCYATMEKIAAYLGKTSDAALYGKKSEQLKKIIHERFFNSAENSYGTGSQVDFVYPMLAQVTPESLVPAVTQALYEKTEKGYNGHLVAGLVGVPVLTEWAIRSRSADWVYGMLKKKEAPGYLYMIENGATTTWEHWNGARSRMHNCYNGIGAWFYHAVGGIRPDENAPGYRRVIIAPQIPVGISWAKTSKETPYGTVVVNWEVKDEMLNMELMIPSGSTGLLELPEHIRNYKMDGKKYTVKSLKEIPSGKHQITCQMN
jgi:alpha-L-rhamnosidase